MARPDGAGSHGFRIVVPGDHRFVRSARRFVASVCRVAGVPEEVRSPVGLALTEILNNAIEHGPADREGSIRVDLEVSTSRVRIRVTEPCGGGFSASEARRIAREARSSSPDDTRFRGRGLLLVCSLMDEMKVRTEPEVGVVVEAVKYR